MRTKRNSQLVQILELLHTGYKIAIWDHKNSKQQKMIKNNQIDMKKNLISGMKNGWN